VQLDARRVINRHESHAALDWPPKCQTLFDFCLLMAYKYDNREPLKVTGGIPIWARS